MPCSAARALKSTLPIKNGHWSTWSPALRCKIQNREASVLIESVTSEKYQIHRQIFQNVNRADTLCSTATLKQPVYKLPSLHKPPDAHRQVHLLCCCFQVHSKRKASCQLGQVSAVFPRSARLSRPQPAVCTDPSWGGSLSGSEIGGLLRGPAAPHTAARAELQCPECRRFPKCHLRAPEELSDETGQSSLTFHPSIPPLSCLRCHEGWGGNSPQQLSDLSLLYFLNYSSIECLLKSIYKSIINYFLKKMLELRIRKKSWFYKAWKEMGTLQNIFSIPATRAVRLILQSRPEERKCLLHSDRNFTLKVNHCITWISVNQLIKTCSDEFAILLPKLHKHS